MGLLLFQSDRLQFSPLKIQDAEDIYTYASDPEVAAYTSWEPHQSIKDTHEYLEHVLSRHCHDQQAFHVVWAIRKIDSEEVIGTISFRTKPSHIGHVDYALCRKYWGQSLMTEAVRKLITESQRLLPELQEIHSGCLDLNIGSVRVLEKCGFIRKTSYQAERGGKFGRASLTTHEYVLTV